MTSDEIIKEWISGHSKEYLIKKEEEALKLQAKTKIDNKYLKWQAKSNIEMVLLGWWRT